MAFDLKAAGNYGSGALGDVTDPQNLINSYYLINSFSGKTFSVANPSTAKNGVFKNLYNATDLVGEEFLIHAFACTNGAASPPQLGLWRVVKIVSVDYETAPAVFTTNKDLSDLNFSAYYWQAVWIPHFKNLTLASKNLKCLQPFASDTRVSFGGVLAFKCSDTLTLSGGHIDLTNCGFQFSTTTTYRPKTTQEINGTLDTDLYAGCENSITKDRLLVNVGDGACWILAKNVVTKSTSRIGNPSVKGVQYCRGAADSTSTHSGSNIGGSTILVACDTWSSFIPDNIAKYCSTTKGRGLARAYIALNNLNSSARPDEGLYALDNISVKGRLSANCNIKSFGDGSDSISIFSSDTVPMNSYAKVTAISADYKTFTVSTVITGKFPFAVGKLVMIHRLTDWTDINSGRFILTKITAIDGNKYTVEKAFNVDVDGCFCQIISIPQLNNATISGEYKATQAWRDGVGGIFAIACKGTLNLSSAKINLEGKGTLQSPDSNNALVGNAYMKHRLFIGHGNGSAFILANTIIMSEETRIGGMHSGASFGGKAVSYRNVKYLVAEPDIIEYSSEGGYAGADGVSAMYPEVVGTGGWGGGGGQNPYSESNLNGCDGGWFGNATYSRVFETYDGGETGNYVPANRYNSGLQGAHILIIADTINNFNLAAISTGGMAGGFQNSFEDDYKGEPGGCGYGGAGSYCRFFGRAGSDEYSYGGAGGYRGGGAAAKQVSPDSEENIGITATWDAIGVDYQTQAIGGGGAGAAFVYCNNFTNQSTTGIITG